MMGVRNHLHILVKGALLTTMMSVDLVAGAVMKFLVMFEEEDKEGTTIKYLCEFN